MNRKPLQFKIKIFLISLFTSRCFPLSVFSRRLAQLGNIYNFLRRSNHMNWKRETILALAQMRKPARPDHKSCFFSFLRIYFYTKGIGTVLSVFITSDNRQYHDEHRSITFFTFHLYFSTMRLHYIITQAQPQPCSLSCRFGSKKRLKYLINDFFRNTVSIVTNGNQHMII